jgi:hypothetical protein
MCSGEIPSDDPHPFRLCSQRVRHGPDHFTGMDVHLIGKSSHVMRACSRILATDGQAFGPQAPVKGKGRG